jgi:hypothetical protein
MRPDRLEPGEAGCPPHQMHLVSQGFPVRIRRGFVAVGVALALALGGSLAASFAGGAATPAPTQDAGVTSPVSIDS